MPFLVDKIASCCKAVNGLKKLGDNGEYAYLRIVDIADALREKLFEAGVLILPHDLDCELRYIDVPQEPGRWWIEAKVKTQFTLTDGNRDGEVICFDAYGFARDLDAKCVAIAQTAALKSFLKRLALIFGDYDDPEVRDESIADIRPDLQRKIDEQTCITRTEVRALYSAIKKGGRTFEDLQAVLRDEHGIQDPHQLEKQYFEKLMKWALNEPA
jgi:hypothetical protein